MINKKHKFNINHSYRFIAIFIAVLVLTLPFYSANAMAASVKVTSNFGEDGIEGYLDAESDIWNLEVEITTDDEMEVSPEQVILEVGGSQIEFSSCSSSSLSTTCEFQSVLSNGINEGTYAFEVIFYDAEVNPDDENVTDLGAELASDTDSIIADGSEPSISFNDISQTDGDLYLSFEVDDAPSSCVGLDKIEVVDAESGVVYETFTVGEIEECSFSYSEDGGNAGIFTADLEGEGARYFKIKATDLLGHEEITASKRFDTDFVAPDVDTNSLIIEDFGSYVSTYSQTSDVMINLTECTDLEKVTASSDFIEFGNQEAVCSLDENDDDNCDYECVWSDLTINPDGSSISASITAIDDAGNEETATATSTFTSDSTGPDIVFFGTLSTFDDLSYVAAQQDATIYAFINDAGAGIDEDSVIANLAGVGGNSEDSPNECLTDSSGISDYYCYWNVDVSGSPSSTSTTEINIHDLTDLVGNDGDSLAVPIVVDGVDPQVTAIEFYGFSAVGEKDFFQSNDDLLIDLTVTESSGLNIYVDVNELVMDAENEYQYGSFDDDGNYVASEYDGWVYFDDGSCSRDDESTDWDCKLSIDSIKSGPDSSVDFQVLVMDTAGNLADWTTDDFDEPQNANIRDLYDGEFSLELFALDEETQPDFWEQSSSTTSTFIDLDIVELAYSRINFQVNLRTDSSAKAALIELAECTFEQEGAPAISRNILLGGSTAELISTPKLDLLLEFSPFDPTSVVDTSALAYEDEFSEAVYEYQCTLHIYSVLDDTAMNYAESQQVTLDVPFAFTTNGALDENVDALIAEHVNQAGFKLLAVIDVIGNILRYVELISVAYRIILGVYNIVEFLFPLSDGLKASPFTASASQPTCFGAEGLTGGIWSGITRFMNGLDVFYCHKKPTGTSKAANWQRGVINIWTGYKGDYLTALWDGGSFNTDQDVGSIEYDASQKDAAAKSAFVGQINTASLYDNVYISTIGLCIPGIIYNLEKLRQIHCSKLVCLKDEVPAGIATVASCDERYRYGICKYVRGELLSMLIPMTGLAEGLGNLMQTVVTNPIGIITSIISYICPANCAYSGLATMGCNYVNMVLTAVQTTESVIGAVKGFPTIAYDECRAAGITKDAYSIDEDPESSQVTTQDIEAES
jgi:hypothetical protein